jgi:hypothetical protein
MEIPFLLDLCDSGRSPNIRVLRLVWGRLGRCILFLQQQVIIVSIGVRIPPGSWPKVRTVDKIGSYLTSEKGDRILRIREHPIKCLFGSLNRGKL